MAANPTDRILTTLRGRGWTGRLKLCSLLALASSLALTGLAGCWHGGLKTDGFSFVSSGARLSGLVAIPSGGEAKALIIIVHGYGRTDVRGQNPYYNLRRRFSEIGVSSVIWDKPGCGESEGTFDINQPVASSAQEVLDAVRALRARGVPGSNKIGLWGISRAGWIAPMAIAKDPGIAFWISVSGTDDKENYGYLLQSNLVIEGRTAQEAAALVEQWKRGGEIFRSGGSHADYLRATERLRRDPFWVYLNGPKERGEAVYLADQATIMRKPIEIDRETGLQIYVTDFARLLSRLDIPVLAIFGEKDTNVNWRATSALYARTIGAYPRARLTIRTFPDGNHNLQRSVTGGLREMREMRAQQPSAGYYEAMTAWLRAEVLR